MSSANNIRKLTAFHVRIGLRSPIRHASHVRESTDSVLVRCELSDGSVGWGESLPRTYVTGDSIDSTWRHLVQTDFTTLASTPIDDPDSASAAMDALQLADVDPDDGIIPRECFGNAARAAMEVAVLDAACRRVELPLWKFMIRHPAAAAIAESQSDVFYSGVITSGGPRKQWTRSIKMKLFGFRQVKVKVGTEGIDDVALMNRVRRVLGRRVDLRLDANEAWTPEELASRVEPLYRFRPTSLEQPVPHAAVAALAEYRIRHNAIPVMLDESLCCLEDAERAIAGRTCDLFNIRLSKCGGIVPSIRLAARARDAGLGYQLGCQVGETGILSAAGRHFACAIGGIRYLEGSYDRFLVRDALTVENMTFRYGGRGTRIDKPGLGITVDPARVDAVTVRTAKLL